MADKKISALTAASTPLAGTEVLPIVQSGSTVKVSVDNLTTGKTVAMNQINLENSTVGFPTLGTASGSLRLLGSGGGGFGLFGGLDGGTGRSWLQAMRTDGPTAYDLRLQPVGGNVRIGTGDVIIETAGKGIDFSANTHAAGMTSELLNWYEEGTWTPVVTAAVGTITSYTASGNYTRIGRQVTVNMNIIITANGTGSAALQIAGLPFNAATVRYDAGAGEEYVVTGNAVVMTLQTTGQLLMVNYNNTYPGGDGYYIAASITYNV
jgi:hypothetical protein